MFHADLLPEGACHGVQLARVAVGEVVAAADRIVDALAHLLTLANGLLVLHHTGGPELALDAQTGARLAKICIRRAGKQAEWLEKGGHPSGAGQSPPPPSLSLPPTIWVKGSATEASADRSISQTGETPLKARGSLGIS